MPEELMNAVALVEDYLAAMGAGRVDDARRHLSPDATLVFPGGKTYRTLAELAEGSAGRYRFVDKHRDEYDTLSTVDGEVVYSLGRLFGENIHGVAFDGVRYVDRFLVRDGLVVEQRVWNDLAESGVLLARTAEELDERWRVP
ncbi:nuclear transport factor 2 family protein [Umezawaea endophytica]|uniref:Nuclear transport factor 2 family protein n=1 Tax=Umezawaea endophytica TaxID=1654476 RepID=A0A9X2ZXT6_9PSEU|nr:nuclear transport factor 2 family protein [Umezawaea endophytica]MCS7475709.1 nuclear transport factor 2 family protein [Umezawaea endophytica]